MVVHGMKGAGGEVGCPKQRRRRGDGAGMGLGNVWTVVLMRVAQCLSLTEKI